MISETELRDKPTTVEAYQTKVGANQLEMQ